MGKEKDMKTSTLTALVVTAYLVLAVNSLIKGSYGMVVVFSVVALFAHLLGQSQQNHPSHQGT